MDIKQITKAMRLQQNHAYIYAIRCGQWLVKIGCAVDVAQRLENISCHNPFEVIVEHCLSTPIGMQFTVERRLHQLLKARGSRFRGEWFSVTPLTVDLYFRRMMQEFEGVEICNHFIGSGRGLMIGQKGYGSKLHRPTAKMEEAALGRDTIIGLRREDHAQKTATQLS